MGLDIEAARNYGVSVLKKASGVDAYQRWQRYAVESSNYNIPSDIRAHRRPIGFFLAGLQVAAPFYVDAVSRAVAASDSDGAFPLKLKKVIQAVPYVMTEALSWQNILLPTVLNHPLETVAIKAAINIGAPVLGDLYYAVTDRIADLRPPAAALAV